VTPVASIGEITGHPVVAPLIVAALGGLGLWCRKTFRILRDIDTYVVSHFRPQAGHEQGTLPGRVANLEGQVSRLDGDLRTHMADEAAQRGHDVARIELAVTRVHERIDALTDDRERVREP